MPTTIFDNVTDNIEADLLTINEDDYGFTPLVRRVVNTSEPTSKNVEPGEAPSGPGTNYTVEIEIQQVDVDVDMALTGKTYYWQSFLLICHISQSDTSETSYDELQNMVYSAVHKTLMADAQRGGNAMDTKLGKAELFVNSEGNHAGIIIPCGCHVRTAEFDPYTL